MIRIIFFVALSAFMVSCEKSGLDLYKDKDDLYGEYFDEPYPGTMPQRFSPQFFSEELHTPPIFSPDGQRVYWKLMSTDYPDILEMKLEDGKWSKPYKASFNLKKNNDAPFITNDGERLYFVSANGSSLDNYDENIYLAHRHGADWSDPVILPDIINDYDLHWEVTVADNYNLYFQHADNHDIYCSEYINSAYQSPVKLPEAISSPTLLEGSPFIAPDEGFIIFDRRSGSGDSDLFISFKDMNGNWTDAISFGTVINTSGHEFYPIITADNEYLFFLRMISTGCFPYWVDAQIIEELRPVNLK